MCVVNDVPGRFGSRICLLLLVDSTACTAEDRQHGVFLVAVVVPMFSLRTGLDWTIRSTFSGKPSTTQMSSSGFRGLGCVCCGGSGYELFSSHPQQSHWSFDSPSKLRCFEVLTETPELLAAQAARRTAECEAPETAVMVSLPFFYSQEPLRCKEEKILGSK